MTPKPPTLLERTEEVGTAESASDEALMERFIHGDQQAFRVLFERLSPKVHAFVLRMVREPALADDLVQTTFLSVVRARGRFQRGQRVAPWVFSIAANAARDALRRRRRRAEITTDDGELPALPAEAPPVRDRELERQVEEALGALPAPQREAVVLHWFNGLSFPEIASVLGTSAGAVKVRAHRGYERLRVLLGGLTKDLT